MSRLISLLLLFPVSAHAADPALTGRWLKDCQDLSPQSQREALEIDASVFRYHITRHSEAGCQKPLYTFTWEARYSTPALGNAPLAIDFELDRITVTPHTARQAIRFATDAHCGLTDWKALEPTEVTGRRCDGNQLAKRGYKAYGLYELSAEGRLTLDPRRSAPKPENRPKEAGPSVFEPTS